MNIKEIREYHELHKEDNPLHVERDGILLAHITQLEEENKRLWKGITKLHKIVPCNKDKPSTECKFCIVFDEIHYNDALKKDNIPSET